MIKFLFGDFGVNFSDYLCHMLNADAAAMTPSVLIVPEQEAVGAEHMTLGALPPSAQLTLEVLNFSRLYNRVCREYGGLCYSYITKPLSHLMMWKALRSIYPFLCEYSENAQSDVSFEKTMLSSIHELKAASVAPDMLEEAANKLRDENPSLAARLLDIALIYSAYDNTVSEQYTDSADDTSRLCEILDEHDFFSGKNVYISSFTSFTAAEHKVIDRIFKTASNVTVTIPLPYPSFTDISTASIEKSFYTLKRNANKWGGHVDEIIELDMSDTPSSLLYLRKNLWNFSGEGIDTAVSCNGCITAEICDNSYDEAEAAAGHILELLRKGVRLRDIAVIMRDAQKYRGIIEPCLERAGVPFFFSEKTDICAAAPVKYLLSALRIRQYNWQKNDVISHIKTGLCDISVRDADMFEEYINTWNISGKRFLDGEWSMNPDGFSVKISERGKEILSVANKTRQLLCKPLETFFLRLDASKNIPDMCRAMYSYMEDTHLNAKILKLAERELDFGNKKTADELVSLYDLILGGLADIGEATGDIPATVEDFYSIFKLVFDNTEIGTIPSSIDAVTVGSASTLRAGNPKYVLVLGLCEGEFPARVEDTGIFGSSDRLTLAEQDIILGGDADTRSSDEMMFVRRAFSLPSEGLYLFTSLADMNGGKRTPSLPFKRVEAMFCDLKAHRYFANDLHYLALSPRSAAAHLRNIQDASEKAAAVAAVGEHLPLVLNLNDSAVSTETCRISPDLVRKIIGDRIYISPSSLEKYVKCPFSYYASYMLSLRETKHGRFGANHIGDFVHYMLENIIRFALPLDEDAHIPTHEEIHSEISRTVSSYIEAICPESSLRTKRMEHLYARLTRLSTLIIDNVLSEFEDSDFRPAFFELRIDGKEGRPDTLTLPLENGAKIVLRGFIDRVDLWRDSDEVYIRIVDYKTGSKKFSLSDIDVGLNTQMLLYLCAVCTNAGASIRRAASLDDTQNPLPAGVVYLSSAIPRTALSGFDTDEKEVLISAESKLSRSGIILDDEKIIHAASHSASKEILMGITQKDGVFCGKPLVSSDTLTGLFDKIKTTLTEIGDKIYSGVADCAPIDTKDQDPCSYCELKPICRKNNFD